MKDDSSLRDQIAYYEARAAEYDQWHRREGRYYKGGEDRSAWSEELQTVREEIVTTKPHSSALEIACGSGLRTSLVT